jgi:hypothetical protein
VVADFVWVSFNMNIEHFITDTIFLEIEYRLLTAYVLHIKIQK